MFASSRSLRSLLSLRSRARVSVPGPALRQLVLAAAAAIGLGWGGATPAEAQGAAAAEGWNAPEALDVLALGRQARQAEVDDGTLESYSALTEGHIYFYVDQEEGEQALIRVDQVAVELYWEAPDLVRQRIVGERSETRLPVRDFRYYLDRLTLVQYGFGDEIQVGQGMDVAGVPHPLAPPPGRNPELEPYDVRLGDSVTLQLPGTDAPLRILELQLRPRDPTRPGVLGSVFLNAADGQLVRMSITFTPSSYVDPRTDRIQVELDYGLWEGRYWLPNRQELEVRREIPEFDVGVGTVIRAVLRVGAYDLNAPMPPLLRTSPRVTQAPDDSRADWEFRQGLFDAMEEDGVGRVLTRVDPRELRAEAARLLGNRPPSGLSPLRFHLPNVSSLVQADRAHGVTLGMGASLRTGRGVRARGWGGYAFGTARPAARLEVDGVAQGPWTGGLRAEMNHRADLGVRPSAPGILSSLGAVFRGEDYLDPYRRSGVALHAERPVLEPDAATFDGGSGGEAGGGRRSVIGGSLGGGGVGAYSRTVVSVRAGVERHRSLGLSWEEAPLGVGAGRTRTSRPVRPVEDGTYLALGTGLHHRREGVAGGAFGERIGAPGGGVLTAEARSEGLFGSPGVGVRVEAGASLVYQTPDRGRELRMQLAAGTRTGDRLPQQARTLGGRGTVAGFPARSQMGGRWILGGIEASREVQAPWLHLRTGLDAAWIDDHALLAVRAGAGVFYDLVRLEVARGLVGDDGEWQVMLRVDPFWWDRL